jgi:hypothetical protein
LRHAIAALFLVPKPFDPSVSQKDIPLVGVPMLKNTSALEIVLAHRAF